MFLFRVFTERMISIYHRLHISKSTILKQTDDFINQNMHSNLGK